MANEMEPLAELDEEQKARIEDWIHDGNSLSEIVAAAAMEPPIGLGVAVSRSAVNRYKQKVRKERLRESMAEEEALAREFLEKAESGSVDFEQATLRILQQKVFNAALESKGEKACDLLRKITEMKQHQERIALAEKNYELAKIRFQMNTTREVMIKTGQYIEIYRRPGIDEEDKHWEARKICFGPAEPPPELIKESDDWSGAPTERGEREQESARTKA